jgi:hypothetical protein
MITAFIVASKTFSSRIAVAFIHFISGFISGSSLCVQKYEDNPGSHTDAMGCFPDISKMTETNQRCRFLSQSRKVRNFKLEKSVTGGTV